jgi:predicted Zn-dependent peptidase
MKVKSFVATYGETFSFSVGVNSLNKKYTLNNENLLKKQFEVLREVLYSPLAEGDKFEDSYYNEIKNDYKESLIDLDNYKEFVVKKKVNSILGDNNKLFEISEGYLNELEVLENEKVFSKYKQMNEMCKEIVIIGDIDFDEVTSYVNEYLSVNASRSNNKYLSKNLMKKYDDYSFDSSFSQSSIGVLFDLDVYFNDKLYYPACVFMELFNYYLFKIVREEYNFCYSIYATYLSSRGLCYLQSNIESKNYEMTLKLINDIINDIKENIDLKVFDICKSKIINGLKKEDDSPLKLITRQYFKNLYNLKDNEEVIEIVNNVSEDDVKKIAVMIEKKFSVIVKEGN